MIAAMLLGLFVGSLYASDEVREILDVPYGDDILQRLDIYLPKSTSARRPAVVWVHGGGWTEGDKRQGANSISVLSNLLVARGFVAFSVNYRLLPKHGHPAQLDDVQRAIRWIRANADKYQVDPDRIGATGISAGGHLVAMLAVRDTRAKQNDDLDKFSSRVQASVSLNGPTDFRSSAETTPVLTNVARRFTGGDAKQAIDASPAAFVDKSASPILFIIGDKDTLIPNSHSSRMAEALKKSGVEAEVLVIPGGGHAIFPSITPSARNACLDFFTRHLKPI
jgi:acetyl esterase/lipase